jgi:CobQ-like glutamine amidotransferase family enzyme
MTGVPGGRASSEGVRIVRLFPDLLGTYGDDGNATVLERRAGWRSISATILDVTAQDDVPDDGNVYLIGGGEDGPQGRAAQILADSGALHRAVERGAAVLAVCAGFQILGNSFRGPDGTATAGLGLLDVSTVRGDGPRIVGEVVVDTDTDLGVGTLTGYENHAGVSTLGPGARPLGIARVGTGNRPDAAHVEGAWQDRIVATYLHGPVLARNPALADRLLAWALDVEPSDLQVLDDELVDALRSERLSRAATERAAAGASSARTSASRIARRLRRQRAEP